MFFVIKDRLVARKDLNYIKDQMKLGLSDPQYTELILQLEADCNFFKQNKLIDYSLLLGVSKIDDNDPGSISTSPLSRKGRPPEGPRGQQPGLLLLRQENSVLPLHHRFPDFLHLDEEENRVCGQENFCQQ